MNRHPNDHKLTLAFYLYSSTPDFINVICPECKNITMVRTKGLKKGINKFSISCGHCGGWRNIELDMKTKLPKTKTN